MAGTRSLTLLEQARLFRVAMGQEMHPALTHQGFIKERLWSLQVNLIREEYGEFLAACEDLLHKQDNKEYAAAMLKELGDLVFVCFQLAAAFGLDLDECMSRIFASNMSKLGDDGKPVYRPDGKVIKGPNYKPPILTDLFDNF